MDAEIRSRRVMGHGTIVAFDDRVMELHHETATTWGERSRTRFGNWLDRLALRGMCFAFEESLMPADGLSDAHASGLPYRTEDLARTPRRFFACLDEPRPVPTMRTSGRRPIAGGSIVRGSLASGYVPFHTDEGVGSCPENDRIPIEHWRHDGPPAATLVALHGFTMGDPELDAKVLMAPEWFGLGLDVVLVTLPYHGARSPAEARFSGERFAQWHVGRLNESVRQAVYDLHLVLAWLRDATRAPIGTVGVSLGGYVAALAAELDPDLAFVIPVAAPVRLWRLPCSLFARSRYRRRMPPPLSTDDLDAAYRVHSPLTYPLAVPRARVMLVAGRGDCIVPPSDVELLWRHWGRPAIHWYAGGHMTPFRRAAILAAGARHLRGLDVL